MNSRGDFKLAVEKVFVHSSHLAAGAGIACPMHNKRDDQVVLSDAKPAGRILIVEDERIVARDLAGKQAAEAIWSRRDTPIIYLTAHSDDETLHRARTTRPCGYLVKPFNSSDLRSAIDAALREPRGSKALFDE